MPFDEHVLDLPFPETADRLVAWLSETVHAGLRRHGAVVGISGGIDSSVVLGLCVRAFGQQNVTAVMMPEHDSDEDTLRYSRLAAECFGVSPVLEEITPVLEGYGCYRRRDEAIRRVFPEYDPLAGYKAKITLPSRLLESDSLNVFYLTVITPAGEELTKRLPVHEYYQIVAASNLKQRTRMSMLYYHAELRNYAVVGTANKNEHDQGFFVKYGDGGADLQPIAHLFKTQVYQLAAFLGVPEEIQRRTPTTDTYSAPCTQEEFFFRLPFKTMDLLWYAQQHSYPVDEVTRFMGLEEIQVQRAYQEFVRKERTTEYLRRPPLTYSD